MQQPDPATIVKVEVFSEGRIGVSGNLANQNSYRAG